MKCIECSSEISFLKKEYADLVWSCASVGIRKAGEKAKLPVEKRERTKTPYMIY